MIIIRKPGTVVRNLCQIFQCVQFYFIRLEPIVRGDHHRPVDYGRRGWSVVTGLRLPPGDAALPLLVLQEEQTPSTASLFSHQRPCSYENVDQKLVSSLILFRNFGLILNLKFPIFLIIFHIFSKFRELIRNLSLIFNSLQNYFNLKKLQFVQQFFKFLVFFANFKNYF